MPAPYPVSMFGDPSTQNPSLEPSSPRTVPFFFLSFLSPLISRHSTLFSSAPPATPPLPSPPPIGTVPVALLRPSAFPIARASPSLLDAARGTSSSSTSPASRHASAPHTNNSRHDPGSRPAAVTSVSSGQSLSRTSPNPPGSAFL